MTTEIRDYGDRKTIVVFTKGNAVFKKLKEWKSCQKVVYYEVWGYCDPRNAIIVAVDIYFNKKEEDRIRKALGMPMMKRKRTKAQREQTRRLTEAGEQSRFPSWKTEDTEKVGVLVVKN